LAFEAKAGIAGRDCCAAGHAQFRVEQVYKTAPEFAERGKSAGKCHNNFFYPGLARKGLQKYPVSIRLPTFKR
jgi:hypothetical protein